MVIDIGKYFAKQYDYISKYISHVGSSRWKFFNI